MVSPKFGCHSQDFLLQGRQKLWLESLCSTQAEARMPVKEATKVLLLPCEHACWYVSCPYTLGIPPGAHLEISLSAEV